MIFNYIFNNFVFAKVNMIFAKPDGKSLQEIATLMRGGSSS
jgi:hypothetical protein